MINPSLKLAPRLRPFLTFHAHRSLNVRSALHGMQKQRAQRGGALFRLFEPSMPELRHGASVHALLRRA